jgi:hypothetical protein
MRLLLIIWSIYLTSLAATPCGDAKGRCEDSAIKTEITQSHYHKQESKDSCTPFCFCSCCSISMASFDFKLYEIKQPIEVPTPQKTALHDHFLISNYHGNIWQPPKVAV